MVAEAAGWTFRPTAVISTFNLAVQGTVYKSALLVEIQPRRIGWTEIKWGHSGIGQWWEI